MTSNRAKRGVEPGKSVRRYMPDSATFAFTRKLGLGRMRATTGRGHHAGGGATVGRHDRPGATPSRPGTGPAGDPERRVDDESRPADRVPEDDGDAGRARRRWGPTVATSDGNAPRLPRHGGFAMAEDAVG